MAGTMLREIASSRIYCFPDGAAWDVRNDYWRVTCDRDDCDCEQYCRMTFIKRHGPAGREVEERHLNFKSELPALQDLLVTYDPYDSRPEHAICERLVGGDWRLVRNGETIATACGAPA